VSSRDERAGPYDTPVSDIQPYEYSGTSYEYGPRARGPQNSAAVEGNSLLSAGSGADASCSAPRALSWCRAEWWRPRAPWLIGAPVKFAAVGGAAPSCSGLSGAAREPLRANSLPAARGRHHSVGHHDEGDCCSQTYTGTRPTPAPPTTLAQRSRRANGGSSR
jgi:hypothetical protein